MTRSERARLQADEDVARVLALEASGQREPRLREGRHVLGRMHRKVDAGAEQRLLDLLGKQALAADFGQRPVLDGVARGADDDELDFVLAGAQRSRKPRLHGARLHQSERAAARADTQKGGGLRHRTSRC
jgi:hypothetical protein